MRKLISALVALTAMLIAVPAAAAVTVNYNSAPTVGWNYGTGNNYSPANTAVLSDGTGNYLNARAHETFLQAPASVGNTYFFASGIPYLSFDWGITAAGNSLLGGSLWLTLTDLGTGNSVAWNPLLTTPNDNWTGGTSAQNSFRTCWFFGGCGGPMADDTYKLTLDGTNFSGGTQSLTIFAQIGKGAGAVPEPATWVLMLLGFGAIGFVMRRQRTPGLLQIA